MVKSKCLQPQLAIENLCGHCLRLKVLIALEDHIPWFNDDSVAKNNQPKREIPNIASSAKCIEPRGCPAVLGKLFESSRSFMKFISHSHNTIQALLSVTHIIPFPVHTKHPILWSQIYDFIPYLFIGSWGNLYNMNGGWNY